MVNSPIVKLLHEDQPPFLNSTNMRHVPLLAIPDVRLSLPVIDERWIGIRISWQCFGRFGGCDERWWGLRRTWRWGEGMVPCDAFQLFADKLGDGRYSVSRDQS
jgi:hypothetical protein